MCDTKVVKMKDSGIPRIGEVPDDWDIIKFKNAAIIENGKDYKDIFDQNGEIPVMGSGGKFSTATKFIYDKPSVLLGRKGTINRPIYVDYPFWVVDTMYYTRVKQGYSPKYLYYCATQFEFDYYQYGSAVPSMTQSDLNSIAIPCPKFKIQKDIVDYLDKQCEVIDSQIEETNQMISKLEQLKQSIISEAVTKGLDPTVEMKDSGAPWIGDIPKSWSVQRIKNISLCMSKGHGITKDDVVENGDTPCVRYGEIYTKYGTYFDECVTRTNLSNVTAPQYFSYGDLLFVGTGELVEEIGKNTVYLGDNKCLAGGDIIIMKHQEDPLFLSYSLNSKLAQSQKSRGKSKLKVVHISATDIGNILIPLPPKEEQIRISKYLKSCCSAIDDQIAESNAMISKLEQLKQSIIYEYVTGKKQVPQEA